MIRRRFLTLVAAFLAMLIPPAIAQAPATAPSYAGKTVLVTGSTDGLGRELARSLAAQGAFVIVHGRNAERGKTLVDEIMKAGKGKATFIAADFASLGAVRDFADRVARAHPKLDLLVNNAGVSFPASQPRQVSADGHELQFAVNYLAGWVLVNRLRPNLAAAAPSRVVNISSGSAAAIDWDDVMLEKPGAHGRGYGQSKLAQVSMTVELAPAFLKQGITMIALHPATMMDTTMVRGLGTPQTTVAEGRDHVMSLINAPTLEAGAFYISGRAGRTRNQQPYDPEARRKLVALSTKLTGVGVQ